MAKKKKNKFPWITFIIIVLLTQYVAAHVSGWLNEVGTWDITKLDSLFDYFKLHPLDVTSFHLIVYLFVYAMGVFVFVNFLPKTRPHAELKGIEHGSAAFLTPAEMEEYVEMRVTPDFPYAEDCRKEAVYEKKAVKR